MKSIPKNRYICKYCWYCECNEEATGSALCSLDIGDRVNVNNGCCDAFEYDPYFPRT